MYKVKIITTGKIKKTWLKEALKEYQVRLQKELSVEWIFLKNWNGFVEKKLSYIALSEEGKLLDSLQFSTYLEEALEKQNSLLHFVLGGPEGIPSFVKEKSLFCLSLSPMTLTQEMCHLFFIEQLYRAIQIKKKTPYHRGSSA